MRFRLLGALEVCRDESPIALGGPRERATLTALLMRANETATVQYLVGAVWDRPPVSPETNLRTYVAGLRRRLGPKEDGTPRLVTGGGYRLSLDPGEFDVTAFEDLLTHAEDAWTTGDAAVAADGFGRALSLWRGELEDARSGPLLGAELARLRERRLWAVERRCQARIELGEHQSVVEELRRLVVQHPMREAFWALLMTALRSYGRRAEAFAAYDQARKRLAEELGVEPGDRLRQMHAELLREDAAIPAVTPAPARPAVPAQLPADLPGFTGRGAELATLLALPEGPHGTVVISAIDGMAGIGKSALAIHAAHALAPRYPDGQLFVDLQGHTQGVRPVAPADALDRLLRSLGLPAGEVPHQLDARAALYRSMAAGLRAVVVLDNAASEEQITPLLPGAPGPLVLVTSRRRLSGLDDVHLISLDVPPLAEATALFVRTVGVDRLADQPAEMVAEVVKLCGRLPLAVRVAAARLRHRPGWTLACLADRLRDGRQRLAELDVGPRSVASTLDLSYIDLSEELRRAYRLFGLHPGADLDAYAAAALADTTVEHAERMLEDLLDVHLLQQRRASRYQFHDLVRAHAGHKAATEITGSQLQEARSRLYDHYAHSASIAMDTLHPAEMDCRPRVDRPSTPTPPLDTFARAEAWLDDQLGNLLAVAAFAARYDHAVQVTRLAMILHRHLHIRARHTESEILQTHALRAARDAGDRVGEAHALNCLAYVQHRQGLIPDADATFESALTVARAAAYTRGEIVALAGRGRTRFQRGRLSAAITDFAASVELARATGDRGAEASGLLGLGYTHYLLGRYDMSARHFGDALDITRVSGDKFVLVDALAGLGQTRYGQGDPHLAIGPLTEALALARAIGTRVSELNALRGVGHAQLALGNHGLATDCFVECVEIARVIGNPNSELEGLLGLGQTKLATGKPAAALADFQRADQLAADIAQPYDQARAQHGLAEAQHTLGHQDRARTHWRTALAKLTALGIDRADDVTVDDIRTRLQQSDVPLPRH